MEATYQVDAAVFSCATAPDGRYVFAGDNCSSVYCFDPYDIEWPLKP